MSKESIKNTISLMLITLIAGLLLGAVYEITKEPIAKENQRAKEEAYKAVFADAGSFEEINLDTDQVQKELDSQGLDASINEAMKVLDGSGQQLGYVLTVTDHEGYGTLNGISFLSISETAGLGMKAKEDSFRKQFEGKNVDQIVYTKNGASADNEIDALSGATITTNAVTNGVNAGLYYVHTLQ